MPGIDFVGAGWAFPLATDATGGVALVVREREIEEAIRLILATAPGERPMRPEFGCRVHDHVFAPINASTAGAIASDVRYALEMWEPRITVHTRTQLMLFLGKAFGCPKASHGQVGGWELRGRERNYNSHQEIESYSRRDSCPACGQAIKPRQPKYRSNRGSCCRCYPTAASICILSSV